MKTEQARLSKLMRGCGPEEVRRAKLVDGRAIVAPATAPAKGHKHAFRLYARTGSASKRKDLSSMLVSAIAIERCECGAEQRRWTTKQERAGFQEDARQMRMTHAASHAFDKALGKKQGWPAMQAAEAFAKGRFKDSVQLVSIDDNHFAGSRLVLVDHANEREFMGTSVVVIPQCTGEAPFRFFMYPGHRQELQRALKRVEQHERSFRKGRS